MASIRAYDTAKGERRYEVRYRDGGHRERSRSSPSTRTRGLSSSMSSGARRRGLLYQAAPERFGEVAHAWLERFVIGAAGRVRPRPKSIRLPRTA